MHKLAVLIWVIMQIEMIRIERNRDNKEDLQYLIIGLVIINFALLIGGFYNF